MVNSPSDDMYPRPPEADLACDGPEPSVPYDRTPEPDAPQPLSWWVDLASTLDMGAWPIPEDAPGAVDFRVTLDLLDLAAWDISTGATAAYGPTDGLRITHTIPEADVAPLQPVKEAFFSIVVPDIATLEGLDVGQPVAINYYSPADATEPLETFHGRVSDLVANPHPQGVLWDISATDYNADLAEYDVKPSEVTSTATQGVLRDIFDALGLPWPTYDVAPTDNPAVVVPTEWFNAKDQIDQLLLQWVTSHSGQRRRYVLVPNIVADRLDTVVPYRLEQYADVAPSSGVEIDAGQVDVGGAFTRRKGRAVSRVLVSTPTGDPVGLMLGTAPARYRVTATVETTLDTTSSYAGVTAAAQFYYPRTAETAGLLSWTADEFTWHLKAAPSGSYLPPLYTYVDVAGIDTRWSPVGATYRGVLSAYTFTLTRARPTLTFQLRDAVEPTP